MYVPIWTLQKLFFNYDALRILDTLKIKLRTRAMFFQMTINIHVAYSHLRNTWPPEKPEKPTLSICPFIQTLQQSFISSEKYVSANSAKRI